MENLVAKGNGTLINEKEHEVSRCELTVENEEDLLSSFWKETKNSHVESSQHFLHFEDAQSRDNHLNLLETLAEDISALILSHLDLDDIANTSLVSKSLYQACRSNTLWKFMLEYRWNLNQQQIEGSYFQAYQQAYFHPHDLWITHWNCVPPHDALSPGRCCIDKHHALSCSQRNPNSTTTHTCPNCRNWRQFATQQTPTTEAQALAQITKYLLTTSLQEQEQVHEYDARDAEQAFIDSATFHRVLNTQQYQPNPTNFLTDLLFYNITDPATSHGQWELQQLLKYIPSSENEESLPYPQYETAHHSWHVVRLYNPDFYRPIVFQTGVQRPECFTVYPSEGYIQPGEDIFVTLGVRPLGSALAYAFESLNVAREGLAAEWADLYTVQAHLPLVPFLIRYRYAMIQPLSIPGNVANHREEHDRTTSNDRNARVEMRCSSKAEMLEMQWQQDIPPHHIRTIHLSAHVHAHYCFADFIRKTCRAWERNRDTGPTYISPVIWEQHENVAHILNETFQDSHALSPSNRPCQECGYAWSLREEMLMQAFILAKLESAWHRRQRRTILVNAQRCMEVIRQRITCDRRRLSNMMVGLYQVLMAYKACPWISRSQAKLLIKLEASVDDISTQIPAGGQAWMTWRLAGVYRHFLSTDSVLGKPHGFEEDFDTVLWKDEPNYMDAFCHLAHSPGRFCLGPQEDPNHLGEIVVPSSKRYFRKQSGFATDLFMDDPISAFQVSICMIQDPRSLLVHGIYDRVEYPGTAVARPRMLPCFLFHHSFVRLQATVENLMSRKRAVHLMLQEALANCFLIKDRSILATNGWGVSLSNYIRNADHVQGIVNTIRENISERSGDHDEILPDNDAIQHGQRIVQEPPLLRGPRMLQILWMMGAQMGLAVVDTSGTQSVFVDRRVIIATQWLALSLMAAPLLWTLLARYVEIVPHQPIDYDLEGLPFNMANSLRYLHGQECLYVSVLVVLLWMGLGRWSERFTSRDFFRVMLESTTPRANETTIFLRVAALFQRYFLRRWDALCPLFLQRRVFTPHWNRRSKCDILKHVAFLRSQYLIDMHTSLKACVGRGRCLFGDERDRSVCSGEVSPSNKVFVTLIVAFGSFSSTSPHFWLNVFTVFSASIGLGMSVSLHAMENGHSAVMMNATSDSIFKAFSFVSLVMFGFLVGQLVGSSGGTMFLAEFIVTSISLVLGGAGTISASAMESWGCFFCLSLTSFWGYLFGRVALMDGIRHKRGGYSSVLLSKSVLFLFVFWTLVFFVTRFDTPVSVMIVRPYITTGLRDMSRKQATRKLQ